MSDYLSDDYTPRRRMQPGTKLALIVIPVLLLAGGIILIVAVANRPSPQPTEGEHNRLGSRPPTMEETLPTPSYSSEGSSRVAKEIFLWVLGFALGLAYLALIAFVGGWVARDAAARGTESGSWALVFLFPHFALIAVSTAAPLAMFAIPFSWLGLIVYLFGRRRGRLSHCDGCGLKHLHYRRCPHCGGAGAVVPVEKIHPPPVRCR